MAKYIFITGGVTSSLGKGILAASLGKLLQARNYKVAIQKLEAYINVDAGTMSPYEHGECYVTNDGVEVDLDLGHYERFLDVPTSRSNYITTGSIYNRVIKREREGDYMGKTVQVVPHITNAIKDRILELNAEGQYDFIISEVGGCIGDIESLPYTEAIRQLRFLLPKTDLLSIHLTLVPYLSKAGELKTKPTQYSVKQLQSLGLQPDIIVCRTEVPLTSEIKDKISLFCNVDRECVIEALDVDTIYKVPLKMKEEGLDRMVLKILNVPQTSLADMKKWETFIEKYELSSKSSKKLKIGLVGKYVNVPDAYKSISEALVHAGVHSKIAIDFILVNSETLDRKSVSAELKILNGIIIGPGYGQRGVEGKIAAIEYARHNKVPILGICYGLQCMVVEFARDVLKWEDASSVEVNGNTNYPVIDLMEEQKLALNIGGTNRLGLQECVLSKGSIAHSCYGQEKILERHRHRYEFNSKYTEDFKASGMRVTGVHPISNLVEIIELEGHPWFVGVQYHPEFKSTPQHPHPLFIGFINGVKNNFSSNPGDVE